MAKRKPKARGAPAGAGRAPRLAFGASVLKEPWFHRACALATREETVATFGEEGGAVWDSIRVTQPETTAEGAREDADPDAWDPTPTYIDRHGNEYYDSAYQVPVPGRSAAGVASAGAAPAARAIAVTAADFRAQESVVDTLDFSRRDHGGDCWYCGAAGNPEPIGEHAEDCPWRQANALLFRIGDALAGDPPGTTTIASGPACRCVTCGTPVGSADAATNRRALPPVGLYRGDWTVAQCDAFDRASGLQRLGPGVVVADDQVDDGGEFVLCAACTAHGLRVAEAVGQLERGTWVCAGCRHDTALDPGRGDGPECAQCGLGVGLVPEADTQDGQEVGPQLDPRAVGVHADGDDVPF